MYDETGTRGDSMTGRSGLVRVYVYSDVAATADERPCPNAPST
jgi:hypothetical protein